MVKNIGESLIQKIIEAVEIDDDDAADYQDFTKSLDRILGADEHQHGLDLMRTTFMRGYLRHQIQPLHERLWSFDHVMDSPIEMAMLYALLIAGRERATNLCLLEHGRFHVLDEPGYPDYVQIEMQVPLGRLKMDFKITAVDYDMGFGVQEPQPVPFSVAVECDGHDFHDRTKEQASRDRRKDREIQKLGIHVFRFTGSDIWKDSLRCAEEVIDMAVGGAQAESSKRFHARKALQG